MNSPFITVVIPLFKGEPFLEECLRSVKNQTFTDFECLLISDDSPGVEVSKFSDYQDPGYIKEQAEFILKSVVGDDQRFRFIRKENGGTCNTRNFGIKQAKSRYVLLLDNDDWWLPEHLENLAKALKNYTGNKYPIARFIPTENYNTHSPLLPFIPKKITLANTIHTCTFIAWSWVFDKELIEKYNLAFDEHVGPGAKYKSEISIYGGEDWLFAFEYLRAVEKEYGKDGYEIINTDPNTYKFREIRSPIKAKTNQESSLTAFAKYYRDIALQGSPSWDVQMVAKLLPTYIILRQTKNPFGVGVRKLLTLFLRLTTNCY
jgi:glycosyltransferase involved in cell wall biosynthesis